MTERSGARPAAEWAARVAELELASVAAFALLEQELESHGAPLELRARCRRAAHDEVRHARDVAALARSLGATPGPVTSGAPTTRSLLELALENAREGTVRELYGAAVATWQAEHAANASVRRLFASVARDESEHAALAFDVGHWLESRLSEEARRAVAEERNRALAELRRELEEPVTAELVDELGLPSPEQAGSLLSALSRELLAA